MPIYEYECPVCQDRTEELQPMKGVAPICTGSADQPHNPIPMKRIFSTHAKMDRAWRVDPPTAGSKA